jgi:hypothetical protein
VQNDERSRPDASHERPPGFVSAEKLCAGVGGGDEDDEERKEEVTETVPPLVVVVVARLVVVILLAVVVLLFMLLVLHVTIQQHVRERALTRLLNNHEAGCDAAPDLHIHKRLAADYL